MNNIIIPILKSKLEEITASGTTVGVEVQRNAVKEILQYYILNFIYHHPEYQNWIMYGGSALRICHNLDRMSVDLDFEVDHTIDNTFLERLKVEIHDYFTKTYGLKSELLTIGITNNRGLTLKFHIAEELNLPFHSKQIHVKIDLNHFSIHPKIVTERWPQHTYQLSFVIKTYNMSALMASKIAAIFLRGERGVGKKIYQEKGRDIYDLLWYMGKKIVPELEYLQIKQVKEAQDLHKLFDTLTIKMNMVQDQNLADDLTPLFVNQTYIQNWLTNWRELYIRLLENYHINTITHIEDILVERDVQSGNFSFTYSYKTEGDTLIEIVFHISEYWILCAEGDLGIEKNTIVEKHISFSNLGKKSNAHNIDKLTQYATLFYKKIESYFSATHHSMLGDTIETKLIRMTADTLNQKGQLLLNTSALKNCALGDLLK